MCLETFLFSVRVSARNPCFTCLVKACLHFHSRCYIRLHDSPPKAAAEEEEAAVAGLPSAERKKMRQKLRKAEAKAKKVIRAHSSIFVNMCSLHYNSRVRAAEIGDLFVLIARKFEDFISLVLKILFVELC